MLNWLMFFGALLALVLLCVLVMAAVIGWAVPTPENRPAPPDVVANREAARYDALRRVADRQRQQQQREASARISRGF